MVRVIELGKSFLDAMVFGSIFVGGTLGFLTIIGFIQWNI